MSLLNFSESSVNQLRALLGTYGNEKIGRILKSSSSYVESRWFKVSEEVTITDQNGDESKEYKAQEVRVDGSLSVNGIIFDSEGTNTNKPDDPIYFKNLKINSELFTGAVEVGKAYQVEFIAPSSYEEETQYYIIPKGGGGGSIKYAVVESKNELDNIYNITLYDSRLGLGAPNPNDTVLLNMSALSNYGTLPMGFYLSVNELDDGSYEPLDIQTMCFGVVIGLSENQSDDHPKDNYDVTLTTSPYGGGFYLGTVLAKAPNVDYGQMGNGAKQTLYFSKENNAWYMNPATFGVY